MRHAYLLIIAAGCSGQSPIPDLPEGFPAPIPDLSTLDEHNVRLGRHLFYDVRLSGNGTQSCGSCHQQALGFTDGRVMALGSTGEAHPRNTSTLTNVGYNATLTWADPDLTDLAVHAEQPLFGQDPIEMDAQDVDLSSLSTDPLYEDLLAKAYPEATALTWPMVTEALESFQRTLISGDSPFDRYTYQGDSSALTDSQKRGLTLFFSERLECFHCHGGFNFTESSVHENAADEPGRFHNTGLYNVDGEGAYPSTNTGLYATTGLPEDMGHFRAPTLRNIAVTGPYFHDGSAQTLGEVLDIYAAGGREVSTGPNAGDGRANPLKSAFVSGFILTDQEREDVLAFLDSLTDESFLTDPRFSDPFGEP